MPKAITFLGDEIKISLYDKTLTIYSKDTYCECCESIVDNFYESIEDGKMLGPLRFVLSGDTDHLLLHQDNMPRFDTHSHIQFNDTIDERKFSEILTALESYSLISFKERDNFIKIYQQANILKQEEKVSFSWMKKGFLLNLPSVPKLDEKDVASCSSFQGP